MSSDEYLYRLRLTHCLLNQFFNDGLIKDALLEIDKPCFEHRQYISISGNILRLLVYGEYPGGDAPHIRNICSIQFCDFGLTLIRTRFLTVKVIVTPIDFRPYFEVF